MAKGNILSRSKKKKAITLIQSNQLEDAKLLLEEICRKNKTDSEAWLLLSTVSGQLGDMKKVIRCCKQVLVLQPNQPDALSNLGNAQACIGQHQEASENYKKALVLKPNNPGITNNLGNSLYLAGKPEEAAEILEKVVQMQPNYADAHNNLGNIYKAINDNSLAIDHYKRALQLNPSLFESHMGLGGIFLYRMGRTTSAEHYYREALRIKPENIEASAGIANVKRFQGDLDGALDVIQELQCMYPEAHELVASEADILERQGKHEAAFTRARQLLDKGRYYPIAIDVLLRTCKRFNYCQESIEAAERMLAIRTLAASSQETLHFALGKLHDKLDNYDLAFKHYQAGNELNNSPFDPEKFSQRIDRLIETFSQSTLASLPRSSLDTRSPIFIVGMPRSGTSLTEQILSSHPDVAGAGELNEVNDIVATVSSMLPGQQSYPDCIHALTTSVLDALAQRYLNIIQHFHTDETLVTDKMPHNFINLGLISLLFPGCRIIHCTRDAKDNCLSLYFQNFGWLQPYGRCLDWLGRYYHDYSRLMHHWESVLNLPILTVPYEETIENQEAMTRKILEFCELEWDDACLQFHKSDRFVNTVSYDQVRQKIYTKSRGRWKNYASHLDPLIKALDESINIARK